MPRSSRRLMPHILIFIVIQCILFSNHSYFTNASPQPNTPNFSPNSILQGIFGGATMHDSRQGETMAQSTVSQEDDSQDIFTHEPQLRSLIIPDSTNTHLQLNETTLNFLRKLPAPLHIVSITGRAKTGKSFLFNRILQKNVFDVGVTFRPGTKGVWMWGPETVVRRKVNPKTRMTTFEKLSVIYMDTEGLGAPGNPTDSYDPKLCALSVMLSSLLLYNVKSEIQIDDVNLLHSVVVLSSLFERTLPGERFPFPPLLWTVQQFQHELDGESPNTYLDWVLKEKENLRERKDIQLYNETVQVVRQFPTFHSQKRIILMDHPAKGRTLPEVANMPWRDLNPSYRSQVNQLRKLVHERMEPKTFNGFQVSGQFLADLLRDLVPELNSIDAPNVGPALIRQLAHALRERLFAEYIAHMEESVELPENLNVLDNLHLSAKRSVLNNFRSNCTGSIESFDNAKAYDELKQFIDDDYAARLSRNTLLTKIASNQLITEIFKEMTDKRYSSVEDFDADMTRMSSEYKAKAKGDIKLILSVLEAHEKKDIRLKKNLVLHENAHKDLGQMLAILFTSFVIFYVASLVFSISGARCLSQMCGSMYMVCVLLFTVVLGVFHRFFELVNVQVVEFEQLQYWFIAFKKIITIYGFLRPALALFFRIMRPVGPTYLMVLFLLSAVGVVWRCGMPIFKVRQRRNAKIVRKSWQDVRAKGKVDAKRKRMYASAAPTNAFQQKSRKRVEATVSDSSDDDSDMENRDPMSENFNQHVLSEVKSVKMILGSLHQEIKQNKHSRVPLRQRTSNIR